MLMVDEINDVRIIGLITALVMMAIATAGLSWESKVSCCNCPCMRVYLSACLGVSVVDVYNDIVVDSRQ